MKIFVGFIDEKTRKEYEKAKKRTQNCSNFWKGQQMI